MKFRGCKTSRGFTLVELLVVISIIAVLMAILLPSLNKARQQGRRLVCSSLLRNIYMAHKTYQVETDKYLPHTGYNPFTPWFNNDYFRSVMGLPAISVEDKEKRWDQLEEWKPNVPKRYMCPSASWGLKHGEDGLYCLGRSYGVNVQGDAQAISQHDYQLYDKESWVKYGSTKLFFTDAMDWWTAHFFAGEYLEYGENWVGLKTYGAAAFRHDHGANILYWDGHVGYLKQDKILSDENLWTLRR